MTHRFSWLLGSAALAAIMALTAAAQEYSNGGKGAKGRGPATLTPVEAFGVHPPGLAPADARHWKPYIPYYAPLSPVASSTRWKPWANCFLLPYYTPYYIGYSPNRHWNPPPRPYGSNGWGDGPRPEAPLPDEPGTTPLQYAGYTSVVDDDTTLWNMGGNGLVPYGAPQPTAVRPPDLVDAIQTSRPHGRGRVHFHGSIPARPPAIVPPTETAGDQGEGDDHTSHRRTKSAESIPPGDVLPVPGSPGPSDGPDIKPAVPSPPSVLD
ncbi:MAG TPA: hypothetical protein VFI31_06840 [Pirellulales bacterium]|nr:hypothetical protein [Pirellulales bacterium]